jgi:hypothetical protein
MSRREPQAIDNRETVRRQRYAVRLARSVGFRGCVEYRHAYSQTGGAQYCIGPEVDADVLLVYAEAFERDTDPHDFGLSAMVAHEAGHQRLVRNRDLCTLGRRLSGSIYEEVLASLIGSLVVNDPADAQHLVWKATVDLTTVGLSAEETVRTIERIRLVLKELI